MLSGSTMRKVPIPCFLPEFWLLLVFRSDFSVLEVHGRLNLIFQSWSWCSLLMIDLEHLVSKILSYRHVELGLFAWICKKNYQKHTFGDIVFHFYVMYFVYHTAHQKNSKILLFKIIYQLTRFINHSRSNLTFKLDKKKKNTLYIPPDAISCQNIRVTFLPRY